LGRDTKEKDIYTNGKGGKLSTVKQERREEAGKIRPEARYCGRASAEMGCISINRTGSQVSLAPSSIPRFRLESAPNPGVV
jgi:hypothetical protein